MGEGAGAALAASLAGAAVACHDAKAVVRATGDALVPEHDTMIAAYLLDPRRRGYPLEELAADAGLGVEGEPAGLRARRRPGAGAGRAPARGARPARAWTRSTARSSCR